MFSIKYLEVKVVLGLLLGLFILFSFGESLEEVMFGVKENI